MSLIKSNNYQVIFCERIIGMAINASISKLELGNVIEDEKGEKKQEITTTVVIPTEILWQTLPILFKQINDTATKKGIIDDLNKFITILNDDNINNGKA